MSISSSCSHETQSNSDATQSWYKPSISSSSLCLRCRCRPESSEFARASASTDIQPCSFFNIHHIKIEWLIDSSLIEKKLYLAFAFSFIDRHVHVVHRLLIWTVFYLFIWIVNCLSHAQLYLGARLILTAHAIHLILQIYWHLNVNVLYWNK